MHEKSFAAIAVVAGILLVLASLAADAIGLGLWPGFGFRQILGTTIGLVLIVVGILVWPRSEGGPGSDS